MKKFLRNGLMLAAAGTLLFTACDPEEETMIDSPSVTFTSELEDSYPEGAEVDLSYEFDAPGKIGQVKFELFIDGTSANSTTFTETELGFNSEDTTGAFTIAVTVPEGSAGSTITAEIEVIDRNNQSGFNDDAEFLVIEAAGINFYEQVLFGAQGNAEEGFYNSLDNVRYSYAEARDASGVNGSPVDFAYYWGSTNKNTIASIDDSGLNTVYTSVDLPIKDIFGTRNSTRFRVTNLGSTEFSEIETNSELVTAADSELNTNSSATNLEVGSVVAFELDADRGGYVGLIHVTQINDTNGEGTITIEVKVQTVSE